MFSEPFIACLFSFCLGGICNLRSWLMAWLQQLLVTASKKPLLSKTSAAGWMGILLRNSLGEVPNKVSSHKAWNASIPSKPFCPAKVSAATEDLTTLATVVAISGVGWGAATTLTCLRSVRYRWYAVRICARYGCYVDHGVGLGWGGAMIFTCTVHATDATLLC